MVEANKDKERLEEIKEIDQEVSNGFALEDLDLNTMTVVNREHFNWLIEQAERGVEYDRHLISLEDNKHYVIGLKKQNKQYREAIEVAIHNIAASENLGVKFALRILEQALEGKE